MIIDYPTMYNRVRNVGEKLTFDQKHVFIFSKTSHSEIEILTKPQKIIFRQQ